MEVVAHGFAFKAIDPQAGAIGIGHGSDQDGETITVFAGFLDEPEELAGVLGMAAATSSIELAGCALDRFGADAAYELLGEWTLLRWHARRRELTVLSSQGLRDRHFFALAGGKLAISPSCWQLGGLSWVGRALDPEGFALNVSRAGLRHLLTDQTMWRGIRLLEPATQEVFNRAGRRTARTAVPASLPRWQGSFEDAVTQLDWLGRRIVRQQMDRHGCCAFDLSGGLDSTLTTAWGSLERGPGREMFAVTSIAPPGSGLADEQEFSVPAAEALGVALLKAWPRSEGELFRPEAKQFRLAEGPVSGAYLVGDQMDAIALAQGATAVVGGGAGEMHISNGFKVPETRSALRIWGAGVRDRIVAQRERSGWPAAAFHVRLSEMRLRALPAQWRVAWRKGRPVRPVTGTHRPRSESVQLQRRSWLPTRRARTGVCVICVRIATSVCSVWSRGCR